MCSATTTTNNPAIAFEPLSINHFSLLHKWMQEPHVSPWWGEGKSWTLSDIQAKYHSYTLRYKIEQGVEKAIQPFIIVFQGQPIGFIQLYNALEIPREDFDVQSIWREETASLAALDFYIGEPTYIGQGLGAKVLQVFLQIQVFQQYEACLVDPAKNNKIALKTYAKAGFSTVKDLHSTVIMIARKREQRNPIIILGSSRSDGDTLQAIKAVVKDHTVSITCDYLDMQYKGCLYFYSGEDDELAKNNDPSVKRFCEHIFKES